MMVDIAKAFDSVQWSFIIKTLQALNFPPVFVHWIHLCISSPSFSVQINGEPVGYFGSTRGLRQGCPLSPYLFVLCLNVLSHMLNDSALSGIYDFHPKCKNVKLTHLCFADDLLVFVDGKERSITGALKVFDTFSTISGLQINLQKSTIFCAGIKAEVLQAVTRSYNILPGKLPVRYLGLPLMTKKMGSTDYRTLVEHIRTRLRLWTGRFLSYAGRLQLLKSVISSIINFWISSFRLPKKCIREINALCSAFLWSGPDLNNRKSKLPWQEVCKPRHEGGLGLRDIEEASKVSSLKLIWRLLSSTSLWSDWVKCYLIRKGSFWSINQSSTLGSWIWKKILNLRQQASTFHRIAIGNGQSTSYWFDNWCRIGQIFGLLGRRGRRGPIEFGISLTATVYEASNTRFSRVQRSELQSKIMQESVMAFDSLQEDKKDTHKWKLKEGIYKAHFSTKQTWQQIRLVSPIVAWSEAVWFQHSTPKYSFLIWLAIKEKLSTCDRVMAWCPGINALCIFCGISLETRNHLFFECIFTESLWTTICGNLLPQGIITDWDTLLSTLSTTATTLTPTTTFLLRYAFHSTVYHVWRERNARRHGSPPKPASIIKSQIDKNVRNRILSLPPNNTSDIRTFGLMQWFARH